MTWRLPPPERRHQKTFFAPSRARSVQSQYNGSTKIFKGYYIPPGNGKYSSNSFPLSNHYRGPANFTNRPYVRTGRYKTSEWVTLEPFLKSLRGSLALALKCLYFSEPKAAGENERKTWNWRWSSAGSKVQTPQWTLGVCEILQNFLGVWLYARTAPLYAVVCEECSCGVLTIPVHLHSLIMGCRHIFTHWNRMSECLSVIDVRAVVIVHAHSTVIENLRMRHPNQMSDWSWYQIISFGQDPAGFMRWFGNLIESDSWTSGSAMMFA